MCNKPPTVDANWRKRTYSVFLRGMSSIALDIFSLTWDLYGIENWKYFIIGFVNFNPFKSPSRLTWCDESSRCPPRPLPHQFWRPVMTSKSDTYMKLLRSVVHEEGRVQNSWRIIKKTDSNSGILMRGLSSNNGRSRPRRINWPSSTGRTFFLRRRCRRSFRRRRIDNLSQKMLNYLKAYN